MRLGTEFKSNIPKGQRTITVHSCRARRVAPGFPRRAQARCRTARSRCGPTAPIIAGDDLREEPRLRERFYREYQLRAYPANDTALRGLIDKRDEPAKLVGRPNYATLNFEDRMLNTPDKVQALIDDMATAAKPAADRDYAKKLAVLQQLQPGATKLEPWDNGYVPSSSRSSPTVTTGRKRGSTSPTIKVRDGILQLTEDMFGVDIRPWKTTKWDKLAESYEVDDHGKLIGRFYFDAHPRPGKYEHANAVPLRYGAAPSCRSAPWSSTSPKA